MRLRVIDPDVVEDVHAATATIEDRGVEQRPPLAPLHRAHLGREHHRMVKAPRGPLRRPGELIRDV